MTITIRTPLETDNDVWTSLFTDYLTFYETSRSASSIQMVWERLTTSPPMILGLLAERDGAVIGLAHFHVQTSTWADHGICYLEDLFVLPSARGQGVASLLINRVVALAREHGCSEVTWITRSDNVVARRLYDQLASLSPFVRYEIDLDETAATSTFTIET
ncbi:MAG: GNAT family N-acetyltransferase [Actinomycetota bacterium]